MANYYDVQALKDYIRTNAAKYGLDPDTALRVWTKEGLKPNTWKSTIPVGGGRTEDSYGPFQFYMGGGMGNDFQATTNLDPRDPKNVYAMADYAMAQAGRGGWTPWHAARDNNIGPWEGIKRGVSQPTNIGYAEANPAFQRAQGSTAQINTLPGPAPRLIQSAVDTNSSAPTKQALINRAVQISARTGEAIPGLPGLGPSRGPLVDKILFNKFIGNSGAASPVNVKEGSNLPPSAAYAQADMQGGPGLPPPAPNIVAQNTNFALPPKSNILSGGSGSDILSGGSGRDNTAQPARSAMPGIFDETPASAQEIAAYNQAHGTNFPTMGGGLYTRGSLGLSPGGAPSNPAPQAMGGPPQGMAMAQAPTANGFTPPNPNSMPPTAMAGSPSQGAAPGMAIPNSSPSQGSPTSLPPQVANLLANIKPSGTNQPPDAGSQLAAISQQSQGGIPPLTHSSLYGGLMKGILGGQGPMAGLQSSPLFKLLGGLFA